MNINVNGRIVSKAMNIIQHYNYDKYWRMRDEVINPNSKLPKIIRLYYLFRIKKMDAFNNASMGTDLGAGAEFGNHPILPHGLNGIIISHYAKLGKGCVIYHQVTITQDAENRSATIGDNCLIGAGAKIIGNVKIGDNVKIGANCVVTNDIPNNCTVIGIPAKIISY